MSLIESATRRVAASFRRRSRTSYAIPVLCYHGLHAPGTSYAENDHTALEEDLRVIDRAGFRVLPLPALVDTLTGMSTVELAESRFVCLSFDDGPDVDYVDYSDERLGLVKSFRRILEEYRDAHPEDRSGGPLAVSFVIASREARTILDRTCIAGRGDWRDSWWSECSRSGLIAIGNHSWDHLHPSLPRVEQRAQQKGSFHIDTYRDANVQVRVARVSIERALGHPSTRLFAYPYGHAPGYLVDEYFPKLQFEHGHIAAFTTAGRPVTRESNRWGVPRYVCGQHWTTPDELHALLRSVA